MLLQYRSYGSAAGSGRASDCARECVQVREALGVEGRKFVECTPEVHSNFMADWMLDVRPLPLATALQSCAPSVLLRVSHSFGLIDCMVGVLCSPEQASTLPSR